MDTEGIKEKYKHVESMAYTSIRCDIEIMCHEIDSQAKEIDQLNDQVERLKHPEKVFQSFNPD